MLDVPKIRKELKEKFPLIKFSIRKDSNSIRVALMAGPAMFSGVVARGSHVSEWWLDKAFPNNQQAVEMLKEMFAIINQDNYTVVVDGDYGAIPSYYVTVTIGQWDIDYIVRYFLDLGK
jgi:hypothetical protein